MLYIYFFFRQARWGGLGAAFSSPHCLQRRRVPGEWGGVHPSPRPPANDDAPPPSKIPLPLSPGEHLPLPPDPPSFLEIRHAPHPIPLPNAPPFVGSPPRKVQQGDQSPHPRAHSWGRGRPSPRLAPLEHQLSFFTPFASPAPSPHRPRSHEYSNAGPATGHPPPHLQLPPSPHGPPQLLFSPPHQPLQLPPHQLTASSPGIFLPLLHRPSPTTTGPTSPLSVPSRSPSPLGGDDVPQLG